MFVHVPSPDLPFPPVTPSLVPELLARLDAVPGEGVFPLAALVDALPAATPIDVEVPSLNGRPPLRRAVSGARAILDRAS